MTIKVNLWDSENPNMLPSDLLPTYVWQCSMMSNERLRRENLYHEPLLQVPRNVSILFVLMSTKNKKVPRERIEESHQDLNYQSHMHRWSFQIRRIIYPKRIPRNESWIEGQVHNEKKNTNTITRFSLYGLDTDKFFVLCEKKSG